MVKGEQSIEIRVYKWSLWDGNQDMRTTDFRTIIHYPLFIIHYSLCVPLSSTLNPET